MSEVSGDRVRKQRPALVAVDLGGESCRVSLLRWSDGQPEIQLVHRFPNAAKDDGSGLRWDIAAIVGGRGRRSSRLRTTRARGNSSHRS